MSLVAAIAALSSLVLLSTVAEAINELVNTRLGEIRGNRENLQVEGTDGQIIIFRGVPYAEPPLGDLRFRKPVPKRPWEGVLDATRFGPSCMQVTLLFPQLLPNTDTSEDCLHLNVYVPAKESTEPRAVMVWIHGGAYINGQAMIYPCGRLAMKGDVICVTLNYRLAIFGFFSTQDDYAVGNWGLWDQNEALKWINKHIEDFGGDPKRVTIFGESAGGASVMHHMITKESEGLFQRGISQSSPVFSNGLAFAHDPPATVQQVGRMAECNTTSNPELINHELLLQCLRAAPADLLVNISLTILFTSSPFPVRMALGPVEDGDIVPFGARDYFASLSLNRYPDIDKLYRKYDIMVGQTSEEGNLFTYILFPLQETWNFDLNLGIPDEIREKILTLNADLYWPKNRLDVHKAFDQVYFKSSNVLEKSRALRDLFSHLLFTIHVPESCEAHIRAVSSQITLASDQPMAKTYMFQFSRHFKDTSLFEITTNLSLPEWSRGASHAEDLPYVFGFHEFLEVLDIRNLWTDYDQRLADTVTEYWTNFAKYGNPNSRSHVGSASSHLITWEEYSDVNKAYIDFGNEVAMKNDIVSEYMNLWLNVIPEIQRNADIEANREKTEL